MVAVLLSPKTDMPEKLFTNDTRTYLEDEDHLFTCLSFTRFEEEILAGGRDRRFAIEGVHDEKDLFYLLTEETPDTFYEGVEVSAVVTGIKDGYSVNVRLDNGLFGTIQGKDFGDDPRDIDNASHRISKVRKMK